MSIIKAQCPNCGAPLDLDTDNDASYCEFCKTPFITEKAIHVHGDYINNAKKDNEWTYKKTEKIVDLLSGKSFLESIDEHQKRIDEEFFGSAKNRYIFAFGLLIIIALLILIMRLT